MQNAQHTLNEKNYGVGGFGASQYLVEVITVPITFLKFCFISSFTPKLSLFSKCK